MMKVLAYMLFLRIVKECLSPSCCLSSSYPVHPAPSERYYLCFC